MSYILDALKKAQAERRQEAVPTLHTQPLYVEPRSQADSSFWKKPVLWISTAGALITVLAVAWIGPGQVLRAPDAGDVASNSPIAMLPEGQEPSSADKPTATVTPELPAMQVLPPIAPPDQESALLPPPKPAMLERHQEPARKSPPAPSQSLPQPSSTRVAATSNDQDMPATRLMDLPASIQAEIPPFTASGYIYADRPEDRSILIGKRILREGDQIAPGLTLERMTPRGLILNYKGHRFSKDY